MYISPTDLLDISIEDLKNIDEKNIIRLEKKLNVLKFQNQDQYFNVNDIDRILTQLKTPKEREVILFIENHPDFKEFISSGTVNGRDTFKFQETYNDQLEDFAPFLDPFLHKFFYQFLKREYNNKNYEIIIDSLKNTALFKNETLLIYHEYIEQQTNFLAEKIAVTPPKTLYEKHPEVTYESHIELLNVVPFSIIGKTKIKYIQELINYLLRTNIFNAEYSKIKNAYVLFSKITSEDLAQQESILKFSKLGLGRLQALKIEPRLLFYHKYISIPFKVLLFAPILIFQILIITCLQFPFELIGFAFRILQLIFGSSEKTRKEIAIELKDQIIQFLKFFTKNPLK